MSRPYTEEEFEAAREMRECEENALLRIEFAKAALTGFLSDLDTYHAMCRDRGVDAIEDYVAKQAWRQADAMLKQRFDKS